MEIEYSKDNVEIFLPKLYSEFLIMGHRFKVTYINYGKNRFSAEPIIEQHNQKETSNEDFVSEENSKEDHVMEEK